MFDVGPTSQTLAQHQTYGMGQHSVFAESTVTNTVIKVVRDSARDHASGNSLSTCVITGDSLSTRNNTSACFILCRVVSYSRCAGEMTRACILVQVTIYRRLRIGRDGHLDHFKACDISYLVPWIAGRDKYVDSTWSFQGLLSHSHLAYQCAVSSPQNDVRDSVQYNILL